MKFILVILSLFACSAFAEEELKAGETAPLFSLQKHDGTNFDLSSRKGNGKWTVLFFYPKAGTPGCTQQACAFRDSLDKIKALGAEVYGISADTVEAQANFHKEHKLNFDLLADPEGKAVTLYGSKMLGLKMSKRWTFVLDPDLKIKDIMKDVDPMVDSVRVAEVITNLQKDMSKTQSKTQQAEVQKDQKAVPQKSMKKLHQKVLQTKNLKQDSQPQPDSQLKEETPAKK